MHYEMITVGMKNAFMYVVRQQKHSFLTSPWALGKEGPLFLQFCWFTPYRAITLLDLKKTSS